ncbi:hypothetical protein ASC77_23185 [Nocardioides sp. Root1257]|uniref:hypothetical protein n=1 Tax=unclassified Nocardioides TaxID=2615069 RepID=UPI0006F53EDD|nr:MULTISPECIES: hypothetical protein [unclassified Nocardioides]KQW42581.1 hypothetical protein ASC77_23185 [Nocardioides sp. Root1257]KRC39839.1 hypothetical protein ASE24_22980 [Nocardioides sp. Root224]
MGTAMNEDRHHLHWATALDRLELEVILAERRLLDPSRPASDPWDEPELEGPIPHDLRDRAVALRERQHRVRVEMTALLGTIGRQHDFANRVDRATRTTGRSVYLDVTT